MNNWLKKYTMMATIPLALVAAGAYAAKQSVIQAEGAYVAAVPSKAENTAAYLTLKNPTDQAITLLGGDSPMATSVEIHQSVETNGKMKMTHLASLEIPAHGEVTLAPMGLHIMLIGLKDSFRSASSVELTLRFSDRSVVKLHAPIKTEDTMNMKM